MAPPPSKEERREQILQAAIACFSRKGYHLTTMDDIVSESGLSKGSLYWHYKNKKDLLLSIMDWYFGQLEAEFKTAAQNAPTVFDRLKMMGEQFAQASASIEPVFNVFIDFYAETRHDDEVNAALKKMLLPYIEMIAAIITEGIANGDFKPVQARQMAIGMMAALDGLVLYQIMLAGDVNWSETAQLLTNTLLTGLRA